MGLAIDSILGTSMQDHPNHVTLLESFDITNLDIVRTLPIILHTADISNMSKPRLIMLEWTKRIMAEFFRQGDEEAELQMEISPLCDRNSVSVPLAQRGFAKFLVEPWFEVVQQKLFAKSDLFEKAMTQLHE